MDFIKISKIKLINYLAVCLLLFPCYLIAQSTNPEPDNWFTGDIHVHRNCGPGTILLPYDTLTTMMKPNNLSVVTMLADMGNGEVENPQKDLPRVNGKNAPQSEPGRIVHWETEWHWDATYHQYGQQALGGHLVLLGLNNAHQIWTESPHDILTWAQKQNAVTAKGFAHLEYLIPDAIQDTLNCCIPVDYPVEAVLGTTDFISEDVLSVNTPNSGGRYHSEGVINAYYKLLNSGIRISLAAGTDYPCNYSEPWGSLLTYVKIPDGNLTYQKWIDGIIKGNTVVSRNGHNEFIDLRVNRTNGPGDDIRFKNKGTTDIQASWSVKKETEGILELVSNGEIIDRKKGVATPKHPLVINKIQTFDYSGWICARRMDISGKHHVVHTSAVYVTVDDKPVRISVKDPQFYVKYIDHILNNIQAGGPWHKFYKNDLKDAQARYRKARVMYQQISIEAQKQSNENNR